MTIYQNSQWAKGVWPSEQAMLVCLPDNNNEFAIDDPEWFSLFTAFLVAAKQNATEAFLVDLEDATKTVTIIKLRVNAFGLPIDATGIIMCTILGKANPGRCLLALLESCAKAVALGTQSIDHTMIATKVYPYGFYTDEIAHRRFDTFKAYSYLL